MRCGINIDLIDKIDDDDVFIKWIESNRFFN